MSGTDIAYMLGRVPRFLRAVSPESRGHAHTWARHARAYARVYRGHGVCHVMGTGKYTAVFS
eukprot:2598983-Rhodomonas_salina.2